jgi:peptidyl-prolyl cis-trans isomerase A (cyclophilin A)
MRPVNHLIILSITLALGLSMNPRVADATIVKFETVMGDFEVNLYDDVTPATVANFLNYVQNGAYSDSIIHRSVPNFIIQGGGIAFDGISSLTEIPTDDPPVANDDPVTSRAAFRLRLSLRWWRLWFCLRFVLGQ